MSFSCDIRIIDHEPYMSIEQMVRYLQNNAEKLKKSEETKMFPSSVLNSTAELFQQIPKYAAVQKCVEKSFEKNER